MTAFLLVRHSSHAVINQVLTGRMPGVHLSEQGREQATFLAEQLASLPIQRVFSGPLERARETAQPLSEKLRLPLQIVPEFDEVNVGEWTGRTFAELDEREDWKRWNAFRSNAKAPGGESMIDVQQRVIGKFTELAQHPGLTVIVSHGDVIRAAVAYYLGVPLDLFLRIAVDPGSVSLIEIGGDSPRIRLVNGTAVDVALRCV